MPRAIWRGILDASKNEALLAVELYNQPIQPRRVEGFFVHMHMAWLLLLHAEFRRDGVDYYYRKNAAGHFVRVGGEPKTWELAKCVEERWPDPNHPVRKNLELTSSLRNKIEHRYTGKTEAIEAATTGYAQASLLNYESEITTTFGQDHSLANQLRFPVFIGTFSHASAQKMKEAKLALPTEIRNLIDEFQSDLTSAVIMDARYEFRVHLVQQLGPKTEADLAIEFVREDDLTEEERDILASLGRKGTVIVRERERPVHGLQMMRPTGVVEAVAKQVPSEFNMHHFVQSWKRLEVRPGTDSDTPQRTDERYCVYDKPHGDYLYKEAFVKKLVRHAQTSEDFRELTGSQPRPKKGSGGTSGG